MVLPSEKNLAEISWLHGVNDKTLLKGSLSSDVNMLEADVLMGRLSNGKEAEIAIMAHPPNNESDLSLMEFVSIVDEFNKISSLKKGIKLDFKNIKAFESAVRNDAFTKILLQANYPVWLNADILEGPLALPESKPVDANRFLKGAKLFPNSILSLGWTTGFDKSQCASYNDSHIEEMLHTLNSNNVCQQVTFAVRAGLVAESKRQINSLLCNNTHTLTIWSAINDDGFDINNLNEVLNSVGVSRIYVDVPDKLRKRLNLNNSTNCMQKRYIL
ncbi:hypothetical protein HHI36_009954 [Cryptolaemus montrouzieri]|uniref:Menorin-like domain-containing protein n=1 Tax=Cryptolaemus montrouzieri TaxID=559131 RepID=A0ABD2MH94_9CUCU